MLTIKKLKKSKTFNEVEVIDISLIYSRVIAIRLKNEALNVENVFSFELYPVPTFVFDDTGNMSSKKSTSRDSKISKKYHFGKRRTLKLS